MRLIPHVRVFAPLRALSVATVIALAGSLAPTSAVLPAAATSEQHAAQAAASTLPGTLVYLNGWTTEIGLGGWQYQIWTTRPDGSNQHQVTADPELHPFSAAANPTGNRIAFTVGRSSRLTASGLYLVGLDGSGRINILAGRKQITEAKNPTWSPDGKRLAFVGYDTAIRKDIWVIDANGKNLRRVTNCDCAYVNAPKWSPTSPSTIAWTPTSAGAETGLSLLDVNTGVSTQLYDSTASGALTVLDHDWEPNGNRIAFTGGTFNQTSPKLYTISSTIPAGAPVPLSAQAPSAIGLDAPLWSPDGTKIAVSAINGAAPSATGQDVWLVDSSHGWDTDTTQITGSYDEEATSWAPTCTNACTPGGKWSSLTVSQRQESNRIRISGGLMPGKSGAKIGVRVQRLNGKNWVTVRSTTTLTSTISTYDVSLRRPRYGTCRVLVSWAGTSAHKQAAARTKNIIC